MQPLASLAVLAALAVGCGGDDDEGGGGGDGGGSGETLTVWNNEFQPDRMEATQAILDDFTEKTGIKTKQVAVPEDQLADPDHQRGGGRRAARRRPRDAGRAVAPLRARRRSSTPRRRRRSSTSSAPTRSRRRRSTSSASDGIATGVPSDGWGQLLIYRKDLFDKAGLEAPQTLDDVRAAAEQLNGDGMVGITLATAPGDGFTAETFEHVALAQGCQLVDDAGDVTFDSPECVEALRWYGDLASNYSVEGAQDVDSTRGTTSPGARR